jgi:hypothetical protein
MKLFREATSELLALQKRERFTFTMLDLIHGALARVFVGTPAKKFCAVPESTTSKVVMPKVRRRSRVDATANK